MKPVIIIALAFVLLIPTTAFGQIQNPIVVTTDKASYSEGETILVTGEVRDLYSGTSVSITVVAPNGDLVSLSQLTVGADKKFSTEVFAGGSLMKTEGSYTITAKYGTPNRSTTTSFEFGGSTMTPPSTGDSGVTDKTVAVEGTKEKINYNGLESVIQNLTVDKDAVSIILTMNAVKDDSITLDIPRIILDSTFNGRDSDFFILIDGNDVKYTETKSSTHRKLTIPYKSGIEKIEIIGTYVIGGPNIDYPEPEQIVCPQGFESVNGKCPDKPVVEQSKELEIASFVDKSKDPQSYIDRYNNEPSYKKWFDDNYPEYDSIEQAVGLELTEKIPDWVKNVFGWYAQDQVSEKELLNAIKYLINEKILVVN